MPHDNVPEELEPLAAQVGKVMTAYETGDMAAVEAGINEAIPTRDDAGQFLLALGLLAALPAEVEAPGAQATLTVIGPAEDGSFDERDPFVAAARITVALINHDTATAAALIGAALTLGVQHTGNIATCFLSMVHTMATAGQFDSVADIVQMQTDRRN